jgi:hypothetical protein
MAFQVFPKGASAPLEVAPSLATPVAAFDELAGPTTEGPTIFILVVKVGDECRPVGGADPQFRLRASGGGDVAAKKFPNAATIRNADGEAVADATYEAAANGLYRMRVFLLAEGSDWELEIVNTDAEPRSFTWVVADSEAAARRPWIDLTTQSVSGTVLAGETKTTDVVVANRGTGTLVISDAVGLSLSSGYRLSRVPGPIAPNACGELEVEFEAPATAGDSAAVYLAKSNDANAQQVKGHNRRLSLTMTTQVPAPTSVDVAILAITMPQSDSFQKRVAEGNLLAAMSAVFGDPLRLGSVTYGVDTAVPSTPGAVGAIADAVIDSFGSGNYTRVTYFTLQGDPGAGAVAVRDQRREALRHRTTTAEHGSITPLATSASIEAEQAVFDVARANGVSQRAIIVIDVVPPPLITGLDPTGGRPETPFTIFGTNLVLHQGDPVSVFWDVPTDPDHVRFMGSFDIVGAPTPTQIVARVPDVNDEVGFTLIVSRSDGGEGFSEEELSVVLL